MNVWTLGIAAFLLLALGLDLAAGFLSLSRAKKGPGPELAGMVPPEGYERVLSYLRARTVFSTVAQVFDMAVLLAFWFAGGFNAWDQAVRRLFGGGILSGLCYLGGLALASALLSLPFEAYDTFILEQRFGFNRTTVKTFLADRAKGAALAVALGVPVASGVMWFFTRMPAHAWLYAWALCAAVAVLLQLIAPSVILPWFFRFQPLEQGSLRDAVNALSRKTGFPLQDITVADGSRRSAKANAFFMGMGKNRRVALFDTLLANHTDDEILAVLAHEIGHAKGQHSLMGLMVSLLVLLLMMFLLSLFVAERSLFSAFFVVEPSVYAGIALFGIVLSPVNLALGIFTSALSRRNERAADRFAVRAVGDSEGLASALRKLSRDNYANPAPHPLSVILHYSHPPLAQRIQAMRAAARDAGGASR
ncbi:MAG: M48 family metallopeptidase [Thermodesulfobacteriota bacterium]